MTRTPLSRSKGRLEGAYCGGLSHSLLSLLSALLLVGLCKLQLTGESSAKQKVSSTNVNVSTVQRGKDEARSRPRLKCKPPRSMCLSREDLASAVTVPSGSVPGEMLVKVTDSQLLTLRRQASYFLCCLHERCN